MSDERSTDGTVCPLCAVGCRLDRDGGRVVGRTGPANPEGHLCRKGLRAFEAVDDADRLTTPLVREGGSLQPASWTDAIGRVVDDIEGVLATEGPDALAFLGAPRAPTETNYLLQKLARTLGTNNVDNRARLCHAATARVLESRLGWPATTNTLADLETADAILVVGANPCARQPVAFDGAVRPAVNGGASLVHCDPHANETTRLADAHLAPRPGTDALVVSLLCALVADADGLDREFLDRRTTGADACQQWLASLDVTTGAERAGVDPDALAGVARTLADADRVAVLTGTGADETATADALVNLLLLTGNLGERGTGFHVLRGLNNEQGAVDAGCVPDRLPGHRPVTDPEAHAAVADAWGVEPPATAGRTEHELLAAFGDEIRAALVVGENPAVSKRDPKWTRARLDALDCLVVHELVPSETIDHADVVLPAAAGVEASGTVTNLDRQVQRLDPRSQPPGDARSDFDVLRALGRSLVGSTFDYEGPGEAFAEFASLAPTYAGLDYGDLARAPGRWPTTRETDGGDSDGICYRRSFATDDGRAPLVTIDLPGPAAESGELALVVADRVGGFDDVETARIEERAVIHPEDAAARDLTDGDTVVLSVGETRVETTAACSEAIRPGTVYLHASVGDPLVMAGGKSVAVRAVDPTESVADQ